MSASSQFMQHPKRWPLAQQPSNRGQDWALDARLVNCFAEKNSVTGELEVQKRFGYTLSFSTLVDGLARGMYTSYLAAIVPTPTCYTVVGNGLTATLYKDTASIASGITDGPGIWRFTETQPTSGTKYIVISSPISSGTGQIYYTTGAGITSAPAPSGSGHLRAGIVYLDHTLYTMDEFGNIFGSNLDDPSTWPSTNLVTASKIPGVGVGLVKQLSYLLALKTASMEVFYDAGNPTGSPLSPVDGATNGFGCGDANTIQTIDDTVLYLCTNRVGFPQIVRVDNLSPSVVSSTAVEKLIQKWQQFGTTSSFVMKISGHRFYGISNDSLSSPETTAAGLTLIYDLDEKMWYQWTDTNGAMLPVFCTATNSGYRQQFVHSTNGNVYIIDDAYTYPTDAGVVAQVDIYTPSTDFDTRRRKVLQRMYIRADQRSAGHIQFRHTDNDFISWSKFRYVNLAKENPYADKEGAFVKRAYHFRHVAPTPLRIRSVDLQMDFGTI